MKELWDLRELRDVGGGEGMSLLVNFFFFFKSLVFR